MHKRGHKYVKIKLLLLVFSNMYFSYTTVATAKHTTRISSALGGAIDSHANGCCSDSTILFGS
eukprot:scaffold3011_cov133-Chaetoceros_neogracile.AAC.3